MNTHTFIDWKFLDGKAFFLSRYTDLTQLLIKFSKILFINEYKIILKYLTKNQVRKITLVDFQTKHIAIKRKTLWL